MVEIRDITSGSIPPEDADCVIIEKAAGRFVVNGSSLGRRHGSFWTPPAFATLDAALEASVDWAGKNDVEVIYLRDVRQAARPVDIASRAKARLGQSRLG